MLTPLLKYPGGKTKELPHILPALPAQIRHYYEPFVGGGAVYFAVGSRRSSTIDGYYINDRSDELMRLYRAVATGDESFFAAVARIDAAWVGAEAYVDLIKPELVKFFAVQVKAVEPPRPQTQAWVAAHQTAMTTAFAPGFENGRGFFADLPVAMARKVNFLRKQAAAGVTISQADFEQIILTTFKSSLYVYYRDLFNRIPELALTPGEQAALYLFIRQYAYSSMFRYSKTGKFNVPYGGMTYNHNTLASRVADYHNPELTALLARTTLGNQDFADFMATHPPVAGDFVFLDPPYDTDFSTYANNEFGQSDQGRLAQYLIHDTVANWMLVIKNTPLIAALYEAGTATANGQQVFLHAFDKSYLVNFKNRNAKDVEHLVITNYQLPEQELL
ncbi:DNA adenine methylase [Lacticaseibacillus suilingensis]|jgi:DNA adenine methylase|uniref:site-specific DNA-methyltransferase (adenine-specific) n=1 Tax=Lacticaseibacillus suilingensis TaxID=2799577 RepID=A0ABW4BJ25_9LACO|nr:DNA adenine methylase [Lacticaseibacillus suilingensis]